MCTKIFTTLLLCFLLPNISSAYWQQHVDYTINVNVLTETHTLDGTLDVTYTNNSPDTLRSIFFHLYYNAFQPGSMMDQRGRDIGSRLVTDRISKLPQSEWGIYTIPTVTANGNQAIFKINGTIMEVILPTPLAPSQQVKIELPNYKVQVPRVIRRGGWMSSEGVEYSMSQWYPKIAEYDQEGWHTQEYIAREFYGVWGNFDVKITLPSSYTVGASGECQNPTEVNHGYDQIAGGIKKGKVGPTYSKSNTTWHFKAENVHDFAWVADIDYVHEWLTMSTGTVVHSLYKSQVAPLWVNSLYYTEFAIESYNKFYGTYPYKNFSNTQAGDGGMEYPQLIMITGYRGEGSLAGVTAHEVAHQWFYGMLGSNESREAFMDEGFTSYATTKSMQRLWGRDQRPPGSVRSWLDWFLPEFDNKSDNYRGYQSLAKQEYEEPLVIPHDWFREDVNAGQVYSKTQAALSMLEYTLGDSVFDHGMKTYFDKWHFKHPHLIDFQKVMEEVSGTDLDWFFDEWFRTTRTLDYQACGVSSDEQPDGKYKTEVRLANRDLAVMPIDLLLHYTDGTTQDATIPLATIHGLGYQKPGNNRIFFPAWDWTSRTYENSTITPKPVSWIEIDTSWRLQDLNWLNNRADNFLGLNVPKGYWAVWKQLFAVPPLDGYYAVVRPIVWYDEPSKLNAGIGIKYGANMQGSGDFKAIFKADPMALHTGSNPTEPKWYDYIDAQIKGYSQAYFLSRLTNFNYLLNKVDGITTVNVGLTHIIRPNYLTLGPTHTVEGFLEAQDLLNNVYPFYHKFWSSGMTRSGGLKYTYLSTGSQTRAEGMIESSLWNSDYSYGRASVRLQTTGDLGGGFSMLGRINAATGTGNIPMERLWHLGSASAYEEQMNDFWRVATDVSAQFDKDANLFLLGGGGMRGYSDSTYYSAAGRNLFSVNWEMAIPNPAANWWNPLQSISFAAFADAGWIGNEEIALEDIRRDLLTDAGLSVKVNILSWLPYQLHGVVEEYAKIPVIGINFPVYLNHPRDGKEPLAFRWNINLGMTF